MAAEENFSDMVERRKNELQTGRRPMTPEERWEINRKIDFLDRLRREEADDDRLLNPTIFLSYAGSYGQEIFPLVLRRLRNTVTPDTGDHYSVSHGMRREGQPEVMKHVADTIRTCSIFVGILTREHPLGIRDADGADQYAPGAWVLYEAGIAIGLDLRVVFLVEEGVHRNFWYDPLGGWRHALFRRETPEPGVATAIRLVEEHYRELRKKIRLTATRH